MAKIRAKQSTLQLEQIYEMKHTTDVCIVCKDEKITAHKCVLAAGSPVFDAMLFGSMKETGDIQISDTSPDALNVFLALIYGKVV